jgi:magnesium-transporting ATPase (P-type)
MGINGEDYKGKFDIKLKMPFSSARKRMSIVVNYKDNATVFIKGASEIVLGSCTQWFNSATGEVEPIT